MLRGSYLRKWAKPISTSSNGKPLRTIPVEFRAYLPTLKLFSKLISMDEPLVNEKSTMGDRPHHFYSWSRWRSYQYHLKKPPEMIKIIEVVISALMKGSLPNLLCIKYI